MYFVPIAVHRQMFNSMCEQCKRRHDNLRAEVQNLKAKRESSGAIEVVDVLGDELIGFQMPIKTVEDFKAFDQCLREEAKRIEVVYQD